VVPSRLASGNQPVLINRGRVLKQFGFAAHSVSLRYRVDRFVTMSSDTLATISTTFAPPSSRCVTVGMIPHDFLNHIVEEHTCN